MGEIATTHWGKGSGVASLDDGFSVPLPSSEAMRLKAVAVPKVNRKPNSLSPGHLQDKNFSLDFQVGNCWQFFTIDLQLLHTVFHFVGSRFSA